MGEENQWKKKQWMELRCFCCAIMQKKRNIGYLLKLPNSFKTLNVLTHAEEWYFNLIKVRKINNLVVLLI
jgi:hypothetical protein